MYPSDGIITSDTIIPAGETDYIDTGFTPGPASAFTFSSLPTSHPSLTILGVVDVTPSAGSLAIIDFSSASQFTIGASGVYSVTYTSGPAVGYDEPGLNQTAAVSSTIENDGQVTVQGRDYAAGFVVYWGESLTNTGTIQVSSTSSAPTLSTTGIGAYNGAVINNSGTIRVSATDAGISQAIGVLLGSNPGSASLINSGSIIVGGATLSGGLPPEAIRILATPGSIIPIVNSGVISASAGNAIDAYGGLIHLTNGAGGSIVGDVLLATGGSQIHNAGSIQGDVHLDPYSNDLYDGRGGTLTGVLYLGTGTDTVFLGDDGETVKSNSGWASSAKAVIIGGAGADAITGGGGIDIIDGGGGDDSLDGGGGVNTVSYASATGGVAVSLALQGARQNTISAGSDLLANFQNLTGSAFNDHLTGDANANVIDGGGGGDVLTGGGGADTFVFKPGYGAGEITDFSHADGDRIDVSVFADLSAFSAVLADAAQVGSNTVISLAGGGTITLDNVQASSLQASDFILQSVPSTIDNDFGGGPTSAVAFVSATTGDLGYMTANASGGETWHPVGPTSTDYSVIAKGDFNGDGVLDIAFRSNLTGGWGFMSVNPSGGETWHDVGPTSLAYASLGSGHFDASGQVGVAFRNAATGAWGYMTANASGGETWHDVGPSSTAYSVVGIGDFDGSGVDGIAFRNNATGDFGYMTANASGGETWHPIGSTGVGYTAIGFGDFNGDGVLDVAFRNTTTGDWGFMSINPGGGETWHGVGATSLAYTPIGSADYNGDGLTDIAFRDAAGDWGFMSYNPANGGETWHGVGPTSMTYMAL